MSETNDAPVNVADAGPMMEVDHVQVIEWHPLPDGRGEPTQVWLITHLKNTAIPPMALRLKSARACDELTDALVKHRQNVFGPRP